MDREPLNPSPPFAVVVNDDPTQLNVLSGLVGQAGLEPRAFTGAEAALADMSAWAGTAEGNPGALPALVVTDLYMPGIDGWRFCRLLRSPEYAAFNQVPLLVVSATFAGSEADRIAADLGAEAFFPSPVDGKRFVEQVRAVLSGKRVRLPLRVLIVEDSPTQSGIFKKAFAAHGYQADTVLTAREAAEAFARTAYDVAVLDYDLPDGTGDFLLDAFRTQRPDCVCLMMTTDPGPDLALEWMKRGAAACLQKPFQPDFLIELCAGARRERALLRVQDLLEARTRELRESEARFRSLLQDVQSVAVQGYGPDGTTQYWNQASERLYGYSAQEAMGRNLVDLIMPSEMRRSFEQAIRQMVETGHPIPESELSLMRKDGSRVAVFSSHAIVEVPGRMKELFCIGIDVTERNQAEEALRSSRQIIERIINAIPVRVFWKDRNLIFLGCNTAFARDAGFDDPRDIIGKDDYQMSWRDRAELYRGDDRQVIKDGCSRLFIEEPQTTPEGNTITLLTSKMPLRNSTGEISGVLGTYMDITERKQTEVEKAKLEAQLLQAQKMESVGRLAGGVAHDFNNMLGVILGHTEMALDQVDPAQPLYDDLTEIRKAAERSANLTRQLLAFARRQTVAPKVLNLNETVEGMLNMLERLIGEDVHLTWQPKADLWPVKVDPSQIDQILANLCINARDAIADVGKITIETGNSTVDEAYCAAHAGFVPGEYVLLAVSDDGCGMGKETLSHLFEPFFTTKGMGKGTGLGLATVYGIVKQNNGFINVYSEPGQGTTFWTYLPRYAGEAGQARTQGAVGPALRGQETILLVEDEPAILKLTTMMLEKQGYTVLAAGTPGEAIRLARECGGEIHLLMTDVVMPEMNGRELAKNLLSLYPRLRCLFASGYTADVIAHHGVLDEGVSFIQKPFLIKDLAAKIREALGE